LVADGFVVTVEDCEQRVFPTSDYAAAGCRIVAQGSWPDAPDDSYIIGLEEPGPEPRALRHRHVFFGHAYKGQTTGLQLLRRFAAGGGSLLDLEHLTYTDGRRVAAFGFWAGYVGASLAVLHSRGRLTSPLQPLSKQELDSELVQSRGDSSQALVIGALGQCGSGARAALFKADIAATCWDVKETRQLDWQTLLDHDIVINTVLATEAASAFLEPADFNHPNRRLSVVSDVRCDVTSHGNLLPAYDQPTQWHQPVRRLHEGRPPLDRIAVDNLPLLLPREASTDFSADLLPHLRSLATWSPPWQRCLHAFHAASTADTTIMEEAKAVASR
jgi:saccharopine dehydrogenase (NAD+, L-lysine-forming)